MHDFEHLDLSRYRLPEDFADEVLTPALVVFLDVVRANVHHVVETIGSDTERWRPHVKTAKLRETQQELLDAGMRHFKCATTREAAVLLGLMEDAAGDHDLLIAYPLVGPALERAGALAATHPAASVSVLCEQEQALGALPGRLGVFVDVNPGMNRTGVPLEQTERIVALARRAGDRFRGIHAYEGHLHGTDRDALREQAFAIYDALYGLVERLRAEGIRVGELVTSGTPGFPHALAYEAFATLRPTRHRVSPGTVVYHDQRSEQELPPLGLAPAALVLSRVVSHPAPGIVTCDAGSKALAAEAGDPCAVALGWPTLAALTPSEEHLPFRVTRGEPPRTGERLLLVPRHVCPTVNLADEAVLVEDGEVRDRVPVAARGHEVLPGRPS
jgi:D-serine deaminase-like pyridoxal phosphate-dependent protein